VQPTLASASPPPLLQQLQQHSHPHGSVSGTRSGRPGPWRLDQSSPPPAGCQEWCARGQNPLQTQQGAGQGVAGEKGRKEESLARKTDVHF
jgi:hypothetical protein